MQSGSEGLNKQSTMQVINWLALQPTPADLEALNERLQEALPLRNVCQLLAETTLRAYPWSRRNDLISCYHPSQTYKQGQKIALLIPDSQNVRRSRFVWQLAQVKQTKMVENPIQGRFQVITLEIRGRQIQMASGIANASYPEPNLSHSTPEDLAWLVAWLSDTYVAALQATLRKLIEKGQLRGRLIGQLFLPEHVSSLSVELLHPFFAQLSAAELWISPAEILKGLADLAPLEREVALRLIHTTLKASPYRSLGADRWTSPELFHQLNRDVPRGLTTPQLRSSASLWTKQDKQDLVGYGRKSMPAQARHLLEELEAGERLPEVDDSPWRPPPPDKPVRLPTLNYLHVTQAYVPVGYILDAFAPEVQLVFVQFMNGDHQPFLLDRENGLLKAVHPEKWRDKILEHGIPAGTTLWLEYEGHEKYRIAPRSLPFKHMVPCKLAHLKEGQLHIEHTQISTKYESTTSLFQANLRPEEVETLFANTSRLNLSLRDVMISAMQEICRTDPDHRAYWSDLFNAVFLRRKCSPTSISFLLYTQPCFESLGGGYFRYKPAPDAPLRKVRKRTVKIRKRTDRLSQLWENLLSDPVTPVPLGNERMVIRGPLKGSYAVSPTFAPNLELPYLLSQPETEPEIAVSALPFVAAEESTAEKTVRKEPEPFEALWRNDYEPNSFRRTRTEAAMRMSEAGKDDLEALSLPRGEVEDTEHSALSTSIGSVSTGSVPVGEANAEQEESSSAPFEDSHAEFSFFSPTLGLEPRPAWIKVPDGANPPAAATGTADPRRFVYRPQIPLRPLHKQPFYRRVFFYLHAWLNRTFRKSV